VKENVILIGFSTTGKSKVGRTVAQRLGWAFVDTDDVIVEMAGQSIPDIFAQDGEDRFRELEREALIRACARKRTVIATGGGAILFEENRALMQERGWVVCLEAKPATIYQRLKEAEARGEPDVVRPLLAGPDPLERITWLKEIRQPYYAIADWTVHTDLLTHEQVVEEILHGLGYFGLEVANARRTTTQIIEGFEPPASVCEEGGKR
jgi:shikimate kinase